MEVEAVRRLSTSRRWKVITLLGGLSPTSATKAEITNPTLSGVLNQD